MHLQHLYSEVKCALLFLSTSLCFYLFLQCFSAGRVFNLCGEKHWSLMEKKSEHEMFVVECNSSLFTSQCSQQIQYDGPSLLWPPEAEKHWPVLPLLCLPLTSETLWKCTICTDRCFLACNHLQYDVMYCCLWTDKTEGIKKKKKRSIWSSVSSLSFSHSETNAGLNGI